MFFLEYDFPVSHPHETTGKFIGLSTVYIVILVMVALVEKFVCIVRCDGVSLSNRRETKESHYWYKMLCMLLEYRSVTCESL
jgi:hypothetical protein